MKYEFTSSTASVLTITSSKRVPGGDPVEGYAIDLAATGDDSGVTFRCSTASENSLSTNQLPSSCR